MKDKSSQPSIFHCLLTIIAPFWNLSIAYLAWIGLGWYAFFTWGSSSRSFAQHVIYYACFAVGVAGLLCAVTVPVAFIRKDTALLRRAALLPLLLLCFGALLIVAVAGMTS